MDDSANVLTVVVVDAKGQPLSGARVSITPSDASGVTDSAGEARFDLGSALKYSVTASAGSNTVTVPYYVTANGATRLVVNPVYVKSVEAQRDPSPWASPSYILTASAVIAMIAAAMVAWKLFGRKRRK